MNDVDARWYHESAASPLNTKDTLERLVFRTIGLVQRPLKLDLTEGLHWWYTCRNWARFGARNEVDRAVLLFDAQVLMRLVRQQLSWDVSRERIKARVLKLVAHLHAHAPVLIFIDSADIERLLRSTIATRGPAFEERLLSVTERCRYGRSRRIAGFKAIVCYWEEYRAICRDLVAAWPSPHVMATADVDHASRQRAYDEIVHFLGIPDRRRSTDSHEWSGYVGTYASEGGSLHVSLQDGELTVLGEMREVGRRDYLRGQTRPDGYLRALTVYPRRRPLMARGENEFDVEGLPIVARFSSEPHHDLTLSAYLQNEPPNTYRRLDDAGSRRTS
jgi:hypothetical protein